MLNYLASQIVFFSRIKVTIQTTILYHTNITTMACNSINKQHYFEETKKPKRAMYTKGEEEESQSYLRKKNKAFFPFYFLLVIYLL